MYYKDRLYFIMAAACSHISLVLSSNITETKTVGDTIVMKCKLSGTLPAWFDNSGMKLVGETTDQFNPNVDLVKEKRVTYMDNKKDLKIIGLRMNDTGEYYCRTIADGKYFITLKVIKDTSAATSVLQTMPYVLTFVLIQLLLL